MKQKIENGIPAFVAGVVFMIVGIISMLEIVPAEQQKHFENVSNIIMFIVACASFFLLGSFSQANIGRDISIIFSNIAVSVIAFLMNLNVFGHELHFKQFLEGLWGWHAGWIICIIVQILVLSGLGNKLLDQIQTLLAVISNVGKAFGSLLSDIWNVIRCSNKHMLLILFFGFLIWSIYGGALSYDRGITVVFSDMDFWRNSALLWMDYLIIIFLIYIIIPASQKMKMVIKSTNGRAILGIALVIILAVLTIRIPSLLQMLAIVIFIPVVATGVLWRIIKKVHSGHEGSINLRDAFVMLISVVGIPLTIIFLGTALSNDSSSIIAQDPTNITSWLEFLNAAAEVAKNLLEFFV